MKKIFILALCALSVTAFAKKAPKGSGLNFEQNLAVVTEGCLDSSIPFSKYKANFEELLDSTALYVLTDPDADFRHQVRSLPMLVMTHIISAMKDSVEIKAFEDRYDQRCKDILYTWYVQQRIDSVENERFLILSLTAAFDDLANQTRVGYTFGANPTGQPVLLMGMPLGTEPGSTMVFFVPKNEEEEILFLKDDDVEVAEENGQMILMIMRDDLEQCMMQYKALDVWYQNDGLKSVSVQLNRFQEQYPAAKKWMMK